MGRSSTINFNKIFFHRHHYGIVLSVLFLGLLVSIAMLYQYQPIKQNIEKTSSANRNPLCKDFISASGKVSCEEAITRALSIAPGIVQKVSIQQISILDPSTRKSKRVDLWLIDIVLKSSYFDEKFQKEIKSLQLGIGVNESIGIYKKPL